MEHYFTLARSIIFYGYWVAILFWLIVWRIGDGFSLLKKQPSMWIPLLLVVFVFVVEALSVYYTKEGASFSLEETLLQVLEKNTQQVIVSIFGAFVLFAAIISGRNKKVISKPFFIFEMMSLAFIVGGVLPLYWLPINDPIAYQILRHVKTVFYTYGIGCFLAGMFVGIKDIIQDYFVES